MFGPDFSGFAQFDFEIYSRDRYNRHLTEFPYKVSVSDTLKITKQSFYVC